jgi:hypothetical protein
MDTSIIGLIVIAVVSVALLASALAWMMLIKRRPDPDTDPATVRERRNRERVHVKEQEALGDPTFGQDYRAAGAEPGAAHTADLPNHDGGQRTEAPLTSGDHPNGLRDVVDAMSDVAGPANPPRA